MPMTAETCLWMAMYIECPDLENPKFHKVFRGRFRMPYDSFLGLLDRVKNDELFPDHDDPLHEVPFRVSKFQAGYAYRLPLTGPLNLALGGTVSTYTKPNALDAAYSNSPMGFTLFAKLSLGH